MQFVVGKGGAGKSTVAAAIAVAAARSGTRVLVVSLDRAHSLGTVFGVDTTPGCADAVHDVPGLLRGAISILELDTRALLERRLTTLAALVPAGGDHDHASPLSLPEPEELTALPIAEELIGLGEVASLVGSGDWDLVVVDCPATADATRLLTVPDLVADGVERVWPRHARVTLGQGAAQWQLVTALLVDRLVDSTVPIRELLSDPDRCGVRLVTEPRRVAADEARRTVTTLALLGLRLDEVVVNGVLPQDDRAGSVESGEEVRSSPQRWYARRSAQQAEVLAEVRDALGGTAVRVIHDDGGEPVGWDALGAVVDDAFPAGIDPASVGESERTAPTVELESGTGVDSVYALRIPLPLVDPASVTLGRVGDDLLVGAAGIRRRWPLASVLKRCDAVAADVEGDDLVVRFRPDPEVWPQ
ncbi:ArsA family ATPase [Rhodococcus gannanensis]|uniref:ArsA family ATPase n=1 Tax=Rhodococcus gannanensis TaxID=1960308 RepID=A0ABW4P463_9NOCA